MTGLADQRVCLGCGERLRTAPRKGRVSTGYCMHCNPKRKWTPESRAKLSDSVAKLWGRRLADPAVRAEAVASGNRLRASTPATPEMVQRQIEGRRRAHWVPVGYEELNRQLKAKGVLVAERRPMVLAQAARDAAARINAMSPFERQMERVRNGARLVDKPVFRRADPAYTLGGVAPEAL